MPSVHDGSLNRLTCALREVGNLTQTWHLQRQHLERVEQPETSTTPPHPPHGLLVTPLFHRSWILKIFEENETFRQSTAIERNYFYQKMDRSIYKRRPRAVISKSAWSQNKRRKKKGKKTGNNKNGATMERRDPRILPPPPAEIHHFKIRENTPLSNRPADKGSKGFWTFVRVPRSDVETRASICVRADTRPLQWTRNAWKRAWLRDTFVYRYRCLGFAAARMEVHSITDLP